MPPPESILDGGLSVGVAGPTVTATFTPQDGSTLQAAAGNLGFSMLAWRQTVYALPTTTGFLKTLSGDPLPVAPFLDPVLDPLLSVDGYQVFDPTTSGWNGIYFGAYPFHDRNFALEYLGTTLTFKDTPADPCLRADGAAAGSVACGGGFDPGDQRMIFQTRLVGVALDGSGIVDTGLGFNWTSNFNGLVQYEYLVFPIGTVTFKGGALNTSGDPVPGSGTGGAAITALFNNTTLGAGAVPEPATWAMMIGGFALAGAIMRRQGALGTA